MKQNKRYNWISKLDCWLWKNNTVKNYQLITYKLEQILGIDFQICKWTKPLWLHRLLKYK
jgi:hypothetical protein